MFHCKATSYWGSCFRKPPYHHFLHFHIGKRSILQVAKTILQEVAALFPDEFLHIGGDEASKAASGATVGFLSHGAP